MKTIRESLAQLMPTRYGRTPRWWHAVLVVALGLAAGAVSAQPTNDFFANATVLTGLTGYTNGDNTLATLENCETNLVNTPEYGPDAITNSVWYAWTAPTSGFLEVDTGGSTPNLDFVLALWTSTNAVPSMCDGSLTNLLADDGISINGYSELDFPVVAGATYYLEVASYADGSVPFDNAGPYQLNWKETIPSLPSGVFKLTQTLYTVSDTDSESPNPADGGTVSPSVLGARITVTRPAPAYGRVTVDYAVTALLYTNIFTTNFFGTNVLTTFIDTNNIMSQTNYYSTNVYILYDYLSSVGCRLSAICRHQRLHQWSHGDSVRGHFVHQCREDGRDDVGADQSALLHQLRLRDFERRWRIGDHLEWECL